MVLDDFLGQTILKVEDLLKFRGNVPLFCKMEKTAEIEIKCREAVKARKLLKFQ
jgi:hypothetical protein